MRGDARPRHPPPRGAPPCAVPGGRRGAPPEGASSAGTLRGGVRGSGVYGVAQGKGGARRWGGDAAGSRDAFNFTARADGCVEIERFTGCSGWRNVPAGHARGGGALEGPPAGAQGAGSLLLLGWGGLGQLCRCRDPGG